MPAFEDQCPVKGLEGLLEESFGEPLEVQHVNWRRLTEPGDNYGSLIISLDVEIGKNGNQETLHLVAKLPPCTQYLLDLFDSPVTFHKEIYLYRTLVPALIELQLENGLPKDKVVPLVPQFYGGRMGLSNRETFDTQAALILENLVTSGYSTEERISGMDKAHLEFAVKRLAEMHALPIALKLKKPEVFKTAIAPAFVPPSNDTAAKCISGMISNVHEDLRNMEEAKPLIGKIDRTLKFSYDKVDLAGKVEEPWGTLVHNDFWVNNMLFKHDHSGKIIDMKIVDFQLYVYDYGMKDLIFFLMSSGRNDIMEENLDRLIDLYYESFIGCLKSLKVDVQEFSKKLFIDCLNKCAPAKLAQCLMMTQVIQAERNKAADPQKMDELNNFKATGQAYERKLLDIVRIYDKRGWFVN
ncbi:uncharacterized protein LOC105703339 isoform X2 [Orussus abietinus]|nr:uncharacterized protein LOC105703339 isoform X2 [Orussus abietinus]XP_012287089.1 uncharacterized protein LOC105703339 isoform X2 [Orussus abietinus]